MRAAAGRAERRAQRDLRAGAARRTVRRHLAQTGARNRFAGKPLPLMLTTRTQLVFFTAWLLFWLLLVTTAVQDFARNGGSELWHPILWESSSGITATLLLLLQRRYTARYDHLLARRCAGSRTSCRFCWRSGSPSCRSPSACATRSTRWPAKATPTNRGHRPLCMRTSRSPSSSAPSS